MALGIKEILELSAPQYLIISILSPIAAQTIISKQPPTLEILPVIIALSFAVLGFNTANMIFDAALDALNKPKRPIPAGRTTKNEAVFLSAFFYITSIVVAFSAGMLIFALILAFVAISLLYSMPPVRLRNFFWGSSATGAILYGAIPYIAGGAAAGNLLGEPIFLAFFIGLLIVISNTKDFEDTIGERKSGISSISTIFGEQMAAYLVIFGNFLLLLGMGLLATSGTIAHKYLIAVLISFAIFALSSVTFLKDIREIRAKNYITEHFKKHNKFNDTFQSDAVTISVLYAIIVELVFAGVSVVS